MLAQSNPMQFTMKPLLAALAFAPCAYAADPDTLPVILIQAKRVQSTVRIDDDTLVGMRTRTSDTAKLLDGLPGISLYGAGGVSSLPAIHGMADDRVSVKVNGMNLVSACANHMNSPLSYIDPANVGSIGVLAGITPVSAGGDSIGGTILVDSVRPKFAGKGRDTLLEGRVGVFYRSNDKAQGVNLTAMTAGENVSMRYTGSTVSAKNYTAGADFKPAGVSTGTLGNVFVAGNEVASSQYKSVNHALDFAVRHENHMIELGLGLQNIPYQGFPNQYMDMLKNDSRQINLSYQSQFHWGKLQARLYNEHTQHYMNFLEAKQTSLAGMPMNTDGKNTGGLLKGDTMLSDRDTLSLGAEYQRYRLNDWWNPTSTAANGMMSPNTFWNINNGQRDRLDFFAEWKARWNPRWISQLGLRSDRVTMNAGQVQGYNASNVTAGMMGMTTNYLADSTAFNAANHRHTDNNIDLTALARYTPDEGKSFEFGFAQKTRSPNLYERYAWSSSSMGMSMNNWFGDGNGYIGNVNLKPEVARTLSVSANWHDGNGFEAKVTPYYTHVQHYIDAARCGSAGVACTAANPTPNGFVYLQFVNQSARLYGADASVRMPLAHSADYGSFSFRGVLSYVNGKNLSTGDNLYHIMPLNTRLALEQHSGNWSNTLEALLVAAKTNVQAARNELGTGGYGLVNLRSSYDWKQFRFGVGVENLFDKFYFDPLGGSYLGQRPMAYGTAVPGMGRSLNVGMTVKF